MRTYLVSLIKRFFKRWSREKEGSNTNCAVILCAPRYDPVTEYTSNWIRDIKVPRGLLRLVLSGGNATMEQMRHCLEQTETSKRIKIFVGHGVRDALLGPPISGSLIRDYDGDKHGVIYDGDLINPTPSALFAFSCQAGLELGRRFCSVEGRNFLGYTDKIPLDVINEECVITWKRIVETISSEIIADGDILAKHLTRLRELYHQALMHFHQDEGKNNDQALLMMMYLLNHQNSLCSYSGTQQDS